MGSNLERELGAALAALQVAELTARDLLGVLERCERMIVNLEAYCRLIDGLPSKVEWDVVRDTLRDAAQGIYDD